MTEQEKAKKTSELYAAWAEGKTLQWYCNQYDKFIDAEFVKCPKNICVGSVIWRIKPATKKQWYRVALIKDSCDEVCTDTVNNYIAEKITGTSPEFVKWLTDRIEYEVEA
jgi:hypothetical protein